MNPGQKVYKADVYSTVEGLTESNLYFLSVGTAAAVELDGTPMVRYGEMLLPASRGWHATEAAAKQEVVDTLVKVAGRMQAVIDKLKDEILHEHLIAEEAAA
jgi:hypothetical protein